MVLPLGPKSDPVLCGRRAEIAQPACDLPASHKRAFPALTPPTLETPSHHQASPGSSDLAGDDWGGGMRRAAFLPVPPCLRAPDAVAAAPLQHLPVSAPLRLRVLSALKNLQTHENAVVKLPTWAAIIGGTRVWPYLNILFFYNRGGWPLSRLPFGCVLPQRRSIPAPLLRKQVPGQVSGLRFSCRQRVSPPCKGGRQAARSRNPPSPGRLSPR